MRRVPYVYHRCIPFAIPFLFKFIWVRLFPNLSLPISPTLNSKFPPTPAPIIDAGIGHSRPLDLPMLNGPMQKHIYKIKVCLKLLPFKICSLNSTPGFFAHLHNAYRLKSIVWSDLVLPGHTNRAPLSQPSFACPWSAVDEETTDG